MQKNEYLKNLNEDTFFPGSSGIATTDQILDVKEKFLNHQTKSIPRQLLNSFKLEGSNGNIYAIRRKLPFDLTQLAQNQQGTVTSEAQYSRIQGPFGELNPQELNSPYQKSSGKKLNFFSEINSFTLACREANTFPNRLINTSITIEALQDIQNSFGKSGSQLVSDVLIGLANEQENLRFFEQLEVFGQDLGLCPFEESQNIQNQDDYVIAVVSWIQNVISKANSQFKKTHKAYLFLPRGKTGIFSTFGALLSQQIQKTEGIKVADFGNLEVYENPFNQLLIDQWSLNLYKKITNDTEFEKLVERGLELGSYQAPDFLGQTVTYNYGIMDISKQAYLVLNDTEEVMTSGLFFIPFIKNIEIVTEPESGQPKLFLTNRFGITANPLHNAVGSYDDGYVFKFNLNCP